MSLSTLNKTDPLIVNMAMQAPHHQPQKLISKISDIKLFVE